jgi:class I fructose-bisphosphate aldolase/fructose-bisphosphate aldolase/2-amino-3,7-dideoxy-D-threo-hept-6-ulosonate synthase
MHTGKSLRLARFFYAGTRVGTIVPIDHGLTIGPVDGVKSTAQIAEWIGDPAITGVIAHKGVVERLADRGALAGKGVMVHLNGMSTLGPAPDTKELVTKVESALALGADAVSFQVNFDGSNDAHNLALTGALVDEAARYGLPTLAMIYDKVEATGRARLDRIRHLMRIAIELGVDALKIGVPASLADVPELFDGLAVDAPIFFAGGSLCDEDDLADLARVAVQCGGAGLCVGRNVFQRPLPGIVLERLRASLLEASLDETAHERARHSAPPGTGMHRRVRESMPVPRGDLGAYATPVPKSGRVPGVGRTG